MIIFWITSKTDTSVILPVYRYFWVVYLNLRKLLWESQIVSNKIHLPDTIRHRKPTHVTTEHYDKKVFTEKMLKSERAADDVDVGTSCVIILNLKAAINHCVRKTILHSDNLFVVDFRNSDFIYLKKIILADGFFKYC